MDKKSQLFRRRLIKDKKSCLVFNTKRILRWNYSCFRSVKPCYTENRCNLRVKCLLMHHKSHTNACPSNVIDDPWWRVEGIYMHSLKTHLRDDASWVAVTLNSQLHATLWFLLIADWSQDLSLDSLVLESAFVYIAECREWLLSALN